MPPSFDKPLQPVFTVRLKASVSVLSSEEPRFLCCYFLHWTQDRDRSWDRIKGGREGGEETELELGKPCLLRESVGRGIVNKDARYGEEDGMSDLTCHVRGCRWH